MRKILVVSLLMAVCGTVTAQLTKTKWKGTLELDPAMDVLFDFRKDTVEAFNLADNSSIEIMVYTVKDSLLTLQKISGISDCNETYVAKYKLLLKDDQFFLIRLEDECEGRGNVLNNTIWKRTQ